LSSSEYEESSDDNEKGPTVDNHHKGPRKAMTGINLSRRNERDSDDDINDVNSDDDGQEEERMRRSSGKGV
jgi:hypothetical protein